MPKSSINNRVTRSSIRGQIPPFRGHNLLWRSKTPGRDVPKHDPQRLVGMKASFAGEIKNAMANPGLRANYKIHGVQGDV
jgi:hypothetical protein